jgi:3-oxo-5-alpha-steroid 4-dehydrogenase 1
MWDVNVFNAVVLAWFVVGLATGVFLFFVAAPYGRHGRTGWGPTLGARAGWIVMELPAVAVVAALFFTGGRTGGLAGWVFFAMWEIHYVQRTFVFPFLLAGSASRMPAAIPAMGFVFNVFNGGLQGGWLYRAGPGYETGWLCDPRFVCGAALFFAGMAMNLHADAVLRNLRKPGETGYKVPRGGLYRWVSCPNYLGEIVEWTGWAVATWSPAGAAFAFWTAANLVPRAVAHHRWYRLKLPDYPKERKAILPFML